MRSIPEHLTFIIDLLKQAIGVHLDRQARLVPYVPIGLRISHTPKPTPGPAPLPLQAYERLWHRAHRIAQRFLAFFASWQANTLPAPRMRPRRTRAATTTAADPIAPRPLRLPRAIGWANKRIPEAAPPTGILEDLLHNRAAELRPFLQAAPQVAPMLRTLCTALGVRLPDYLALPPRRRSPPKPKPPKPPRPNLKDPTLRWRDWELRAVRASLRKYGRA